MATEFVFTIFAISFLTFCNGRITSPDWDIQKEILAEGIRTKPNGTIVVTVGLTLQNLDFHPEEEIFEPLVWMNFEWQDKRLTWDPTEFNNVSSTRVYPDQLWTPDIFAYNMEFDNGVSTEDMYTTRAIVDHTGDILWVPPLTLRLTCVPNMDDFPWGNHTCRIKVGSWTYSGDIIDLKMKADNIDISGYVKGRYELLETKVEYHKLYYACCPEPYVDITYYVTFRQKYYIDDNLNIISSSSNFLKSHYAIILLGLLLLSHSYH